MTEITAIQKRRLELLKLFHSPDGRQILDQLYSKCFPPDVAPPTDGPWIETILKYEFPDDPSVHR